MIRVGNVHPSRMLSFESEVDSLRLGGPSCKQGKDDGSRLRMRSFAGWIRVDCVAVRSAQVDLGCLQIPYS